MALVKLHTQQLGKGVGDSALGKFLTSYTSAEAKASRRKRSKHSNNVPPPNKKRT